VLTLRRVVLSATDLRRLRTGLEVAVVERTQALERSQAALAASERMAALGQFASGFALEVGHPVKVAAANLEALKRELRDDPRDRVWARIEDARAALARVGTLARQLLVAGRAATAPATRIDVRVGPAIEAALAAARARAAPGVALEAAIAPGLTVTAQEDEVVELLTTLVLRGMGDVPTSGTGTVRVRAEPAGAKVRITVEDDGVGMSEETRLHAFEPFHESELVRGAGLALAVARGLVEGMGGTLRLDSAAGRGTSAVLELARGAPEASEADLPAVPLAAPRRALVLVVDADPRALRESAAIVAQQHEVEGVAGVREGLAALADRSFDVVLCDTALPLGGAERFWEELLLLSPAIRGRVAFLTSGAEQPSVIAFLARQPQPVLRKPFGLAEAAALIERLTGLGAGGAGPRLPGTPPPRAEAAEAVIGKMARD
jgi:nitrogen-specific signal transduction histidine kinase/CheY-like chemotaxis protein